jgi:hypothetical protein
MLLRHQFENQIDEKRYSLLHNIRSRKNIRWLATNAQNTREQHTYRIARPIAKTEEEKPSIHDRLRTPSQNKMISKRQATKSDDLLTPWIVTTKRKQDRGADREKGNNQNWSRENQQKNKHPNNKEASCNYQNSSTLNIELLMRFGMLFRLSLNLSSKKVYHSIIPTSRSV